MPTSIVPAAFENIEESHEIAVRIGVRLSERVSHARLAREENNVGKTMFTEQRRNRAAAYELVCFGRNPMNGTRHYFDPHNATVTERPPA